MRYDYKIPEQAALYRKLKAAVEGCVKEGMSRQETQNALTGMGSKMWGEEETSSLIGSLHWYAEQPIKQAAYAAKLAAERAAAPPAPPEPKKRLRHITRQNKKTKIPVSGKYETRHLKDYPGYWIDEMSTVFGPNGQPIKYRYHKGQNFVRLKSAAGTWTDKAVYWLMVGVGFEEHPSAKKARRTEAKSRKELLKCYNDEPEAIAEDPEMFGQVE